MRRANDIRDEELRDFCEWFSATKTSQPRQWIGQQFAARQTRKEWLLTSVEGAFHFPKRDLKKLLRRMKLLKLIKEHDDYVELLKQ